MSNSVRSGDRSASETNRLSAPQEGESGHDYEVTATIRHLGELR